MHTNGIYIIYFAYISLKLFMIESKYNIIHGFNKNVYLHQNNFIY